MPIIISTRNSKLGVIPSINLPPIITCRENTPCSKGCYACKGNFRFKNVKQSMQSNLETYRRNPDFYFESIIDFLSGINSYGYFRWHSAGDIVDERYLEGVVSVASKVPQTKFLLFTKKYEIINQYMEQNHIPLNLSIVLSAWGTEFVPLNPHKLPVAYVRFPDQPDTIPSNSVECSGDCTNCLSCWTIKNGQAVVFNKH